jgi:cell division protein FtsQ
VVRIVERTPVAVLPTSRGFELVDSAGVPLEKADERIPGFPIVDLQGKGVDDVPFTAAAEVLVALPDELRAQVDTITARTLDDVSLVLTGGERVVWGSASDSVRKAQHLSALLQQSPTDVTEYDVSSPGVGILR